MCQYNILLVENYLNLYLFFRGSVIAKIVGKNVVANSDKFEKNVRMWMYEENINGRKLTEIVNTDHENVKYLPGVKLPENVVSEKTIDYVFLSTLFCIFVFSRF